MLCRVLNSRDCRLRISQLSSTLVVTTPLSLGEVIIDFFSGHVIISSLFVHFCKVTFLCLPICTIVMSETPKSTRGTNSQDRRLTRANSAQSNNSLTEIKELIERSKTEIIQTLRNEIERLNMKLNDLENKVISLEGENKLLNENYHKVSQELSQVQMTEVPSTEIIAQEIDDRIFRRPNLIISGVQETGGSVDERKIKDKEVWATICSTIGMDEAK